MNYTANKFELIGAGLLEAEVPGWASPQGPRLGITRDRRGREVFTLQRPPGCRVEVIDLRPNDRHLLLLTRMGAEKARFLCGHDERHYFVAAVPEPVSTVEQAKEALKPPEARRARLRRRERGRRRTPAYQRQGEWFFLPAPGFDPAGTPVHRDEPISRGGGRPHVCEELCRTGGETVYVHRLHAPGGLAEEEYRQRVRANPQLRRGWSPMRRDATVYVRGKVTHPDHATIRLPGWHRLLPNTESRAPGARQVAFLD